MAGRRKVIVLLSGGIDSAACLHYYKKRGYSIKPLFVDFGQPSKVKEIRAARKIAKHFKVKLRWLRMSGFHDLKKGEIPGRNLFFISCAYMSERNFKGIISMGIHSGTDYVDCSPSFVKQTNNILSLYSNGTVLFEAPFLDFVKDEIIEYSLSNEIPIDLTYSCELGLNQPCGKCLSCKDLIRAYDRQKHNS